MKLLNFPRGRQTYNYDCGPKVLQMVLAYYGREIAEEKLISSAKMNKKTGTTIKNMCRVLEKHTLHVDSKKMNGDEVMTYIDQGIPVIMLVQAREDYHRVIAIGYDETSIIFEDPYSFHRVYIPFSELEKRWKAKEKGKKISQHGIAVYGREILYDENKIVYMEK